MEFLRPQHADGESCGGDDDCAEVYVRDCLGYGLDCADRSASDSRLADEWEDLQDDDDDTDAGHESGDDGVWRVCDESSDFEDAEEDLYDACENDNAECFAEVVRSGEGYDGGHSDGHGTGRSGNLRFGTAEYSGEESDSDSAVDTGDGAET